MHKSSFTWIMIIALVFVLFLGTQTSSNYTSSSSSTENLEIDTGDAYKNSVIKNKSNKVKRALRKLPPNKMEEIKKADGKDFKNIIDQIQYEQHMPKPLYVVTASSSMKK